MSVMFFKSRTELVESNKRNWSNQEIADFYRAVDILKQAGLNTEVDSGVTDEGDPWFVFIRPDNGDIIAHFAHIDGSFIAVSSLNREVYKGRDIRNIVDQMLDRHPMLLPQNKNSGSLFLHPTAALSAFLAAAFILTIDGVKASSLQEIMIKAGSENTASANNGTATTQNELRLDTLKPMFSDLNSSNYNVAILGAALIVHELTQSDFMVDQSPEVDEIKIAVTKERAEESDGDNADIAISSENNRSLENDNYAAYSFKKTSLKNDEQEDVGKDANEKSVDGKPAVVPKHDLVLNDASVESVANFSADYEVSWKGADSLGKANYQSDNKNTLVKANDEVETAGELVMTGELEIAGQLELGPSDDVSGAKLGTFVENLQGAFEKIPSEVGLETNIAPDNVVVTFESTGELRLVSLQSLEIDQKIGEPKTKVLEPYSDPESFMGGHEANSYEVDSNSVVSKDEILVSSDSNEDIIPYVKPILGHSLKDRDEDEVLHLSDAVDVVFYQGGNAEISGFQLGTDLLWFFLSAEELATAQNSVNQDGDLIVNFHDLGTLTFLGIVTDPLSPDYMV